MKKTAFILGLVFFLYGLNILVGAMLSEDRNKENLEIRNKATLGIKSEMKILSSAFQDSDNIPYKYTCNGENINPPLTLSGVPEGSKTLALIFNDPDAPNGDWSHWLVWNIDPGTKEIKEGEVPDNATEGTTDFGKPGYGGPCPPTGTHHYIFSIYALDTSINLDKDATKSDLEKSMAGHILEEVKLTGLYEKK